jgi:diacylglycerol kinase (ATP)
MGFKALAVVNPNSSNGSTGKQWPRIREEIAKHVEKFEYVFTEHRGHATDLARHGIKEGYEMIIAVGGDGTNNEVINGFFENDSPVNPEAVFSHITRGTGGDLRKTTGVPKKLVGAAAVLAGDATRRIDCGRMTLLDHSGTEVVRYFLNIASFGIGGKIDDKVNKTTKAFGGFASFAWSSITSIFTYENQVIHLKIDGEDLGKQRLFNTVIANGRFFGGGMMVAPDASMDDGLFDIIVLGDLNRFEVLTQMIKIYNGGHVGHPKVKYVNGKVLEATSDETVLLDVDGEQPGSLPATFTIVPGAVRLKVLG